jgi:hypothetical protein
LGVPQGSKDESSFFEKKEAKKLLSDWNRLAPLRVTSCKSFFASFFSKKEDPCFLPPA